MTQMDVVAQQQVFRPVLWPRLNTLKGLNDFYLKAKAIIWP